MTSAFFERLKSRPLSWLERGTMAIMAELCCPPWKFDILWEVWPNLELRRDRWKELAAHLLDTQDPDVRLTGRVVFDDLTIFADVIGADWTPHASRDAFRAAYLLMRPMRSRTSVVGVPVTFDAVTKRQYLERLLLVGCMLTESLQAEVHQILAFAGTRYLARGKPEGEQLCKQTIDLL